jgi:tetratricopeptide (TPR) repeat protein
MQNTNKNILLGIVALILIAGAWWFMQRTSHPLPLVAGDTVSSWDYQGTYEDGGDLEKRTRDLIARLEGQLGGDQSGGDDNPTDYELYVGIANQYELLGDGKAAYEYLGKAISIDPVKTGLGWRNLGALLERLGAVNTARSAYSRAVEAQVHIMEYHIARLEFLVRHFPDDATTIDAAIAEAEAQFGETPEILQIQAQWYEKTGRMSDAISAWTKLQTIMGQDATIESEIARLKRSL